MVHQVAVRAVYEEIEQRADLVEAAIETQQTSVEQVRGLLAARCRQTRAAVHVCPLARIQIELCAHAIGTRLRISASRGGKARLHLRKHTWIPDQIGRAS